jgi:hypothetical protein
VEVGDIEVGIGDKVVDILKLGKFVEILVSWLKLGKLSRIGYVR